MRSKIEEAIEDFIQGHITGLDFSDMITTEVSQTWDMDELDRVDDTVDRVDALEAWINDAEDKLSIQNVINLENLVKSMQSEIDKLKMDVENFQRSEQYLQCAWKTLSDNLEDDLEALRNEKSFFQKLIQKVMFWR